MAVRPETLEHPERSLGLVTRVPAPEGVVELRRNAELDGLRERIASAKLAKPPDAGHCRDCWDRGWRAAIAWIEGKHEE